MLPPRPNLRHLKDQAIACVNILLDARGTTRYDAPGVLELLRGQLDRTDGDRSAD